VLKYDTDGSYIHLEGGKLISREITTYNNFGKFLEWIRYDGDDSIKEIRTYQFDKNKRIIEWSYLNADRSVNYIETAAYDEWGNRLEYVARDYRDVCAYNKSNQPVVRRFYNKDRSLKFEQIFEYDEFGNKLVEKTIEKDREFSNKYIYDNNNLLIEEVDGLLNFKRIYKYDTDKKIINETGYDQFGNINFSIFYEYDENGMLIGEREEH
jgi:hypothetical protein